MPGDCPKYLLVYFLRFESFRVWPALVSVTATCGFFTVHPFRRILLNYYEAHFFSVGFKISGWVTLESPSSKSSPVVLATLESDISTFSKVVGNDSLLQDLISQCSS